MSHSRVSIIRIVFTWGIKSFNHHNPLIPSNLWWWKSVKGAQVVRIVLFAGQAKPCSADMPWLSGPGRGRRMVHLPSTTTWACFTIFFHRKPLSNNKIGWWKDFVPFVKTNVVHTNSFFFCWAINHTTTIISPIACSRTSIVLSFCHSEQTRLVLTTCFLLGTELRGFRGKNKKIRVNLQNSMPDTLLMSWLAR